MKEGRPVFGIEWGAVITQDKDEQWRWKVTQYRREVDGGKCKTEAQASKAAYARLAELAVAGAKKAAKFDVVGRMVYQYRKKRPFVLAHVLQCLSIEDEDLRSRESCVGSAEERERELHDSTHVEWRVPISDHHLAKPAEEIAGKFWDACVNAGIVGKKADKRGERLFGYWWVDPAMGGVWAKVNGQWTSLGPGKNE